MPNMITTEGARTLAQAVIIQAVADARSTDLSVRGEARRWLSSQETADTWGVLAGLDWNMVLAWMRKGYKIPRHM
jgi:hypothetical protein